MGDARQLTRDAKRPADEEALELLTAIDPTEPTLRKLREGTGAVSEEAIERVDRCAHECDFAFTPSLVLPQHAQCARVFTFVATFQHPLRKRGGIQESEIHSLSRERMNDVRGITDQGDSLCYVAMSSEPSQREGLTLAYESSYAQGEVGRTVQLDSKISGRRHQKRLRHSVIR